MPRIDWADGRYEVTAAQLLPAAREVVEVAAVRAGERVLDVGCGTGNAALLAAERGADVVGIDPAERLLVRARERAAAAGLAARFVAGTAAAPPVRRAFDVVLSVFAVIFAPDPAAALRSMADLMREDARLVMTAWVPDGAIAQMGRIAWQALSAAETAPAAGRFAWHDVAAVTELAAPLGLTVAAQERTIAFTGESPQAYVDRELELHPVARATARQIAGSGRDLDDVRRTMIAALEDGNEDASAFRATSRYLILTMRRS